MGKRGKRFDITLDVRAPGYGRDGVGTAHLTIWEDDLHAAENGFIGADYALETVMVHARVGRQLLTLVNFLKGEANLRKLRGRTASGELVDLMAQINDVASEDDAVVEVIDL